MPAWWAQISPEKARLDEAFRQLAAAKAAQDAGTKNSLWGQREVSEAQGRVNAAETEVAAAREALVKRSQYGPPSKTRFGATLVG